jgi:hypothetical protein
MSWSFREPTITEMLSDPIVVAMMKADGIDPVVLEAELRAIAQRSTLEHSCSIVAPDPTS